MSWSLVIATMTFSRISIKCGWLVNARNQFQFDQAAFTGTAKIYQRTKNIKNLFLSTGWKICFLTDDCPSVTVTMKKGTEQWNLNQYRQFSVTKTNRSIATTQLQIGLLNFAPKNKVMFCQTVIFGWPQVADVRTHKVCCLVWILLLLSDV